MALAALEILGEKGFPVSSEDIHIGLEKAFWPGRMQVLARSPLLVLDGAHNPAAIRVLARSLRETFSFRRLILVLGIMADKDIPSILKGIVPSSDYVFYTRPAYLRAASPEVLLQAGASFETIDAYKRLAESGQLKIRLWVMVGEGNARIARRLARYRMIGVGDHHLTVRAIKRFIDGALGAHGAWLLAPYDDLPASAGLNTSPVSSIRPVRK